MNKLKIVPIFIVLLVILALRFFFFYQSQPHYTDGQYIDFKTTLFSEPKIFGNYQILSANLGTTDKILIRTTLYPKFYYQDTVRISGKIKIKTLGNKRTITIMYFPKIEAVKKDKNALLSFITSIRQNIILLFAKTLPQPSSGLMLGIVFGIKESMPKDFVDTLRASGVLHVVAASGMNVSMVGAFSSSIFTFFLRRQIAILASILVIIFYAILSGLEPSIIRASIMGILVYTSQILGRQSLGAYGLFLAGFTMLYFSPLLIFDVGFQLSFFATFGLFYLRPIFESDKIAQKFIKRSIIGEEISTTIVAQLATLPIILTNFGIYSIWSIAANALVLWTILPLMILGGFAAIVGIIVEPIGKAILYLSIPLLFYFQKMVEIFGGFRETIKFNQFPWQLAVGYYMLLASLVTSFKRNIKL
ncbi:MAG: ComEC/Rec2 family competence protein [Patescibacteria group bacterium]